VYIDFLNEIYKDVKNRGYEMQFWSDIILNRIYASTANNNSFDFNNFINLLKGLEDSGIKVVNSSFCSRCDYDKYLSSQVMKEKGVLNPKTKKVSSVEEVKKFFLENKGPIIFKPNTGGRGIGVRKIDSINEISKDLFLSEGSKSPEFIVQDLAKSIVSIDYRVFVYGNKVLFVNSRTLVDGWLGSRSQGSEISLIQELPDGLEEASIKATKAIDAKINSLDIVKTKEGFSIIENNPTPNFNQFYIDSFGFNPIEILVKKIILESSKVIIQK